MVSGSLLSRWHVSVVPLRPGHVSTMLCSLVLLDTSTFSRNSPSFWATRRLTAPPPPPAAARARKRDVVLVGPPGSPHLLPQLPELLGDPPPYRSHSAFRTL